MRIKESLRLKDNEAQHEVPEVQDMDTDEIKDGKQKKEDDNNIMSFQT